MYTIKDDEIEKLIAEFVASQPTMPITAIRNDISIRGIASYLMDDLIEFIGEKAAKNVESV